MARSAGHRQRRRHEARIELRDPLRSRLYGISATRIPSTFQFGVSEFDHEAGQRLPNYPFDEQYARLTEAIY